MQSLVLHIVSKVVDHQTVVIHRGECSFLCLFNYRLWSVGRFIWVVSRWSKDWNWYDDEDQEDDHTNSHCYQVSFALLVVVCSRVHIMARIVLGLCSVHTVQVLLEQFVIAVYVWPVFFNDIISSSTLIFVEAYSSVILLCLAHLLVEEWIPSLSIG